MATSFEKIQRARAGMCEKIISSVLEVELAEHLECLAGMEDKQLVAAHRQRAWFFTVSAFRLPP